MEEFVGFRGPGGRSPTKSYSRGETVGLDGLHPPSFLRMRFHQCIFSLVYVVLVLIYIGNPSLDPLYNKLASVIPASCHFHLQLHESAKCDRLNVKTVTPGIYVLYLLDFHHTFKHIRGPHARFCWIPGPRRSFSNEILLEGGEGGPRRSTPPPLAFSARGSTNGTFHCSRLV